MTKVRNWISGIWVTFAVAWGWAVAENSSEALHDNVVAAFERAGMPLHEKIIERGVDVLVLYFLTGLLVLVALSWVITVCIRIFRPSSDDNKSLAGMRAHKPELIPEIYGVITCTGQGADGNAHFLTFIQAGVTNLGDLSKIRTLKVEYELEAGEKIQTSVFIIIEEEPLPTNPPTVIKREDNLVEKGVSAIEAGESIVGWVGATAGEYGRIEMFKKGSKVRLGVMDNVHHIRWCDFEIGDGQDQIRYIPGSMSSPAEIAFNQTDQSE